MATTEEILVKAEKLLAEGQHGVCDATWKRKVRDYFSDHERGNLRSESREQKEQFLDLFYAIKRFIEIHDSGIVERDMQSEWAARLAHLRLLVSTK